MKVCQYGKEATLGIIFPPPSLKQLAQKSGFDIFTFHLGEVLETFEILARMICPLFACLWLEPLTHYSLTVTDLLNHVPNNLVLLIAFFPYQLRFLAFEVVRVLERDMIHCYGCSCQQWTYGSKYLSFYVIARVQIFFSYVLSRDITIPSPSICCSSYNRRRDSSAKASFSSMGATVTSSSSVS